jgi:hypothetical protein
MHRRAQRAEGALERAQFWVECIRHRALQTGDGYMRAVADEALREMRRQSTPPQESNDG